jgi:uncharacterized protein with GYD domain
MYLVRFSYTPEAWKKLVENPEDRRGPIAALVEAVGGKLHGLWYAFGEQDGVVLVEAPDNVAAAAVSVTASASGTIKSTQMTVLLTVEELTESLQRAAALPFEPPGG